MLGGVSVTTPEAWWSPGSSTLTRHRTLSSASACQSAPKKEAPELLLACCEFGPGEFRYFGMKPRAESREPRAESREPRAESREPRAESREPRAESREPRAESREPRAESREPRAESREPRAESREPRAESREPRAESREPSLPCVLPAGRFCRQPAHSSHSADVPQRTERATFRRRPASAQHSSLASALCGCAGNASRSFGGCCARCSRLSARAWYPADVYEPVCFAQPRFPASGQASLRGSYRSGPRCRGQAIQTVPTPAPRPFPPRIVSREEM